MGAGAAGALVAVAARARERAAAASRPRSAGSRPASPTRIRRREHATRAVALIREGGGQARIDDVARSLGWSRRRIERAFARDLGIRPKVYARIVRLNAVLATLDDAERPRAVDLALEAGYFDQAHLLRDFRILAGRTPRSAPRERRRDGAPLHGSPPAEGAPRRRVAASHFSKAGGRAPRLGSVHRAAARHWRTMSRQMVVASALALLAARPARGAGARGRGEGLAWMEGTWTGEKDGVPMEEVWTDPRGGALLGLHRDVKGGRHGVVGVPADRTPRRRRRLLRQPALGAADALQARGAGDKRAVFENKAHDFPQRILYWIDAAGALHARIEGPQGGKTVVRGVGVDAGPVTRVPEPAVRARRSTSCCA